MTQSTKRLEFLNRIFSLEIAADINIPIPTIIERQAHLRSYTAVYRKIKLVVKSTGACLQGFKIRNTYGQLQITGEQLGGYRRQLV
jgi:hypothetical protein